MRFRRPPSWRYTIHFCGWARECRSLRAPWCLYFNFLLSSDGTTPPRVDLTPPWVRHRNDAWLASLPKGKTRRPPEKENP
jgi:hypothetical protein